MSPPIPIPVLLMVRELGIGGCERDLTKVAIGLDRSRFRPYVGCFYEQGLRTAELRSHEIPIVKFNVPSFASLAAVRAARLLGDFIKAHRIQVLHAFDAPTDMFAVPVARLYRTPAVISSELSYRHLVQGTAYRYLLRMSEKFAHKVVVNSAAVKADLVDQAGVSPGKIFLSHNGVDASVFAPEPRVRKMFPEASVIVGAVCALRPEKRLDLLLDAFARVRGQCDSMRLLLVGSGPMLASLKQQASALHLDAFCHFEPSTTSVAEWLRSMDVFVMSSESESFPNALLEAMACGCCVIGARVGGVPELIVAERNGLLFEPRSVDDLAAKLSRVVSDGELRRRIALEATQTAREDFPIEAAVRRLQNLYLSLLSRGGTERLL